MERARMRRRHPGSLSGIKSDIIHLRRLLASFDKRLTWSILHKEEEIEVYWQDVLHADGGSIAISGIAWNENTDHRNNP